MRRLIASLVERVDTSDIEPSVIEVDVRAGVRVKAFVYVKDGKIVRYTPPDKREVEAQIKDGTAKVTSVVGASKREVFRAAKRKGVI